MSKVFMHNEQYGDARVDDTGELTQAQYELYMDGLAAGCCSNCEHFKRDDAPVFDVWIQGSANYVILHLGECRRMPPFPNREPTGDCMSTWFGEWPDVEGQMWCGEFSQRSGDIKDW
jgi:hypothetical protein